MARPVTYENQTVNSANPAARFAHRSRIGRSVSLACSHVPMGGSLVDFGAGTGHLLDAVRSRRPDAALMGVEPYKEARFPEIRYVPSMSRIDDNSTDVVTAFEVCEHLHKEEITEFLDHSRRVLKRTGSLIVSVPIMYGPVILLKEPAKMLLMRRACEYTARELVNVLCCKPISRPANPRHTHKGFDFRELKRNIERQYEIVAIQFSPFPKLPWPLNSQIFLIARIP
jgi:hypothetical protein